jgi:hypothetical protein
MQAESMQAGSPLCLYRVEGIRTRKEDTGVKATADYGPHLPLNPLLTAWGLGGALLRLHPIRIYLKNKGQNR